MRRIAELLTQLPGDVDVEQLLAKALLPKGKGGFASSLVVSDATSKTDCNVNQLKIQLMV